MKKNNAWGALAFVAAQAFAQAAPVTEPTWSELLAAHRYPELEERMGTALEAGTGDLANYRAARRQLTALVKAQASERTRFDEWVAATGSGTAYLVRGEFLEEQAFEARGQDTLDRTDPDALEEMEDLLTEAGTDYEAALDKVGPRCDLCYAGLITAHMALGQRGPATALVDRAMQSLDGGIAAPRSYLFYLAPKWGGHAGEEQRFVDRFAADGPQRAALPLLRGVLLRERSETLLGEGRADQALLLAQQATGTDPGNAYAWQAIVLAAAKLQRGPEVLEASERALALQPDLRDVLAARASVLLRGPTPLDAVPVLERAVALGDEWALKALLPIVASGQHGFPPDRARAERICQSAIDAQMATGFACMGGLEYFGVGRPADKPRALQWFLQASDRDVETAMVDAGLMLLRGDGVPRDEEKAIQLLLRARAQGEPRADGHLRAALSPPVYWWRVQRPDLEAQVAAALEDDAARTQLALLLAFFLATSLSWAFVHQSSGRPAKRSGGRRQLRSGWGLRIVLLADVALIAGGLAYALDVPVDQRWWAWPVLGLLVAAATYLMFAFVFTRIWFDRKAVHHRVLFGGRTSIHFDEVVAVGGGGRFQGHYIEGRSGARIYVSLALRGAAELLERVRAWQDAGGATLPASRI